MLSTRLSRILFGCFVCTMLLLIGRNFYRNNLRASLLNAAVGGDEASVRTLVGRGADPNSHDEFGETPLTLMLAMNYPAAALDLIQSGAAINAANRAGSRPLDMALRLGNAAVVRALTIKGAQAKKTSWLDALASAAQRGDGEMIELVLAQRKDISSAEIGAILPDAIRAGKTEMVNLLLTRGADPNAADRTGWTPFMTAAYQGNLAIAKTLLAHGAQINAQVRPDDQYMQPPDNLPMLHLISSGTTALMQATMSGRADIVQWLLKNGADPNLARHLKIRHAVKSANPQETTILRRIRMNDDQTPLMVAAQTGNLPLIKLLLAGGADVHRKNGDGMTALMYAQQSRHTQAVNLLASR